MGKYNRVSQGEVKRRSSDDFNRQQVKRNPDEQIIRIENAFDSFIGRKIWDRVQRKIGSKSVRETRQRRKNPDRYLLSGLVVCGCCGGLMHGTAKSKKKNGKRYEWPKYICSTYHKFGNRKKNNDGTGCYYNTIDQNDLLEFLLRKLRQAVLGCENREKLKD